MKPASSRAGAVGFSWTGSRASGFTSGDAWSARRDNDMWVKDRETWDVWYEWHEVALVERKQALDSVGLTGRCKPGIVNLFSCRSSNMY